jgi:hypothetical protein
VCVVALGGGVLKVFSIEPKKIRVRPDGPRRGDCGLFAGVRYDLLEGYASLQWPVGPGGTYEPLHQTEHFASPDGRARLFPLPWREPFDDAPWAQTDMHREARTTAACLDRVEWIIVAL